MPDYRRAFVPGATFFFTLVTHDRQPLLASPEAVALLRQAIATVQADQPFSFDAGVVRCCCCDARVVAPPTFDDMVGIVGE